MLFLFVLSTEGSKVNDINLMYISQSQKTLEALVERKSSPIYGHFDISKGNIPIYI